MRMPQTSRSTLDNVSALPSLELVRAGKSDELGRDATVTPIRAGAPRRIVRLAPLEADEFYANPPCTD